MTGGCAPGVGFLGGLFRCERLGLCLRARVGGRLAGLSPFSTVFCVPFADAGSARGGRADSCGGLLRTDFLRTWPSRTGDRTDDPQPGVVNNFATRLPGASPRWIVQHYTYDDYDVSVDIFLRDGGPSSHFLLPRDGSCVQQLVAPEYRAYHAGPGELLARSALNPFAVALKDVMNSWSYGFENVNNATEPFPQEQIKRNICVMDVLVEHTQGLDLRFVIGHSDWAFGRKIDPGPYFPWRELAQASALYPELTSRDFGVYSHVRRAAAPRVLVSPLRANSAVDVKRVQTGLRKLGYPVPVSGELDEGTVTGVFNFKIHYQNEVVLEKAEESWKSIAADVDAVEHRARIAQWTVDDALVLDDVLAQYAVGLTASA